MFEREVRDMAFIPRWTIVRKLRTQSLAEHSYLVAMYANDLCDLIPELQRLRLNILQYALWHDLEDEIFTGDMPGPAKRALVKDKATWSKRVAQWTERVFGLHRKQRNGMALDAVDTNIVKAAVKVADWLDAACEMATEVQLGNAMNCAHHRKHDMSECLKAADLLMDMIGGYGEKTDMVPFDRTPEDRRWQVWQALEQAVDHAEHTVSEGPLTDDTERAIAGVSGLLSRSY